MYKYYVLLLLIFINGCAYTVFAPPKILYSSENGIGVKYRSEGIQSHDEPEKAMDLVAAHCQNKYKVTNRSEENGWTTIDAECTDE